MRYSVIFLLEDPNEDFPNFVETIDGLFSSRPDSFEIIVMANGTGGFLKNLFRHLPITQNDIKVFEMNNRTSQAVCLKATLKECSGEYIVVCGSYKQITFSSFEKLLDAVDDKTDIISPWRQNRIDPSFNQFQSKLFNGIVRMMTGEELHDLSCTVKIFRREVLEETALYGDMYRYLPIVAARKGFTNKEVKCEHQEERGKTGFYSLSEYLSRLIDIFTLYFNTRFTRKPLRFFSSIGVIFLMLGLVLTFFILAQKLLFGLPVGNRPLLILAIFLMVIGVQSASIGLLGEIIVFTHGRQRKEYVIEKKI